MKISLKTEWPVWLLIAAPFVYLALKWNQIPDSVPLHWNASGEIDRWGDKAELWVLPCMMLIPTYLILLAVPAIDPKGQISRMGVKYQHLKFIIVGSMALLCLVILHLSGKAEASLPGPVFAVIGLMFAMLGNYFKTLKPNYFIGIRTPWTLENAEIWNKTHRLGGILWFAGGLLIAVAALLLDVTALLPAFFTAIGIMVGVPLVYSYVLFRKMKGQPES